MENKYNFNLNPPQLSDEDIAKHQDFEALLAQVPVPVEMPTATPAKPARKYRLLYFAGAAAAACLLGFFFYHTTVIAPQKADQAYFAEKPFIDPPFKAIQANYTEKKVNANQGGIFEYENGSKLIVPAAAFIDDQGNVIEGYVEIRYREFHDFVDFFISGIPMQYDSLGTTYQLESAGMVEIYAEQDGKKVNVAPGKKIDVELVSEIMVPSSDRAKMPKFNVYQLDTDKRNWVYNGRDNIEVLEEEKPKLNAEEEVMEVKFQEDIADLRQQEQKKLNTIEASMPRPPAPVRPERGKSDEYSFNLEFTDEDVIDNGNELENSINETEQNIRNLRKLYEGTIWQLAPNNPDFDQKAANNINWEDMNIERINNRDYVLTLISGSSQMKVNVNPVLTGKKYDNAVKEFNQQFAAYEAQLAEREAELAEQKASLRKRYEALRKIEEEKYEAKIKVLRDKGMDHVATDEMIRKKIVNRFQATTFGIWNCDRPIPPFLVRVNGEFKDASQNEFNGNTAFLVNQNRNTVCRFHTRKGAKVNFNKDSDNMMWLVTPENKLALFPPEEFRQINNKEKDFTFVMKVIDKKIETEEDVRKILEF